MIRRRAFGILLRGYFTALPGMPALIGIGVLAFGAACLATERQDRVAWIAAAACFLVGVPALCAGMRFRELAAYRRHLLLPGFGATLLASAFVLTAGLATLLAALGTMALDARRPDDIALAWLVVGAVFWFGFLPPPLRVLLGVVGIAIALRLAPDLGASIRAADPRVTGTSALLAILGWIAFARWFTGRWRDRRLFEAMERTRWDLPLGLPFRNTGTIGTPAGTLLLGGSDALGALVRRAALGILLIPLVLLGGFVAAGAPTPRMLDNPLMLFFATAYAFALTVHLAQRAALRLPSLWLRVPGDWPALHRFATRVLGRELVGLALAFVVLIMAIAIVLERRPPAVHWLFAATWLGALAVQVQLALWRELSRTLHAAAIGTHLLIVVGVLVVMQVGDAPGPTCVVAIAQPAIAWMLDRLALGKFARAQSAR